MGNPNYILDIKKKGDMNVLVSYEVGSHSANNLEVKRSPVYWTFIKLPFNVHSPKSTEKFCLH